MPELKWWRKYIERLNRPELKWRMRRLRVKQLRIKKEENRAMTGGKA